MPTSGLRELEADAHIFEWLTVGCEHLTATFPVGEN